MGELGSALSTDADSDDVDSHRGPAAVLTGEPQSGQAAQPPNLVRRHRLLHTAEDSLVRVFTSTKTAVRAAESAAMTSSSP